MLWSSSSSSSVFSLRLLSLIITSSLYSEATPANLHSLRTKVWMRTWGPFWIPFQCIKNQGGGGVGHSRPEVCCKDLYSDWSWNCLSQWQKHATAEIKATLHHKPPDSTRTCARAPNIINRCWLDLLRMLRRGMAWLRPMKSCLKGKRFFTGWQKSGDGFSFNFSGVSLPQELLYSVYVCVGSPVRHQTMRMCLDKHALLLSSMHCVLGTILCTISYD